MRRYRALFAIRDWGGAEAERSEAVRSPAARHRHRRPRGRARALTRGAAQVGYLARALERPPSALLRHEVRARPPLRATAGAGGAA